MGKTRIARFPRGLLTDLQAGTLPIYQQLYEDVRLAVLKQELAPGARLPSSQAVAEELGVARSTVVQAYETLISEGYLYGVAGSGTYVAHILPEDFTQSPSAQLRASWPPARSDLSERGMRMLSTRTIPSNVADKPRRAFDTREYATDDFPLETWATLAGRRLRSGDRAWLQFNEAAGYRPLREALATYLTGSRSVSCSAEQIVIFSGLASATTFISQVLIDPGDPVWIEDPGWPQEIAAFQLAGADIIAVPTDAAGLDVNFGIDACPTAKLAFVVPSSQIPFGTTMSMARRLALLQWAHETSAWIIENDFNGEFRYRGRPLPSLQGLDRHGRTLYLGTFSRTLFPSLRLAYAVVPESLVDRFVQARELFDIHPPVFEQLIAADFMNEGHFGRHIRRLRRLHAERQQVVIEAASTRLEGLLDIVPNDAGIFLVGWLPEETDEDEACRVAALHEVSVDPLHAYYYRLPPDYRPGLVLGYTNFESSEIEDGVDRLAGALRGVISQA
jgi:GntR family transcriptional regulator/MocR family aminotransferase